MAGEAVLFRVEEELRAGHTHGGRNVDLRPIRESISHVMLGRFLGFLVLLLVVLSNITDFLLDIPHDLLASTAVEAVSAP